MFCQDEGSRKGCIATRSGKNFHSGIESFWNSIRHTGIEY